MNIKEIAKLAGVSIATVSRVMNNTGYNRQEVKDKVLRVIQETGYIPDPRAKNLRRMKADTVGVVIPNFENQFAMQVITSIESRLLEAGFLMLLTSKKHHSTDVAEVLNNLVGSYVDGVIIMAPNPKGEIDNLIASFSKPIVHIGFLESVGVSIIHRDWDAYYKMAEYLLNKGYQNIAVCFSARANSEPVNTEEKINAIETALKEKGLCLNPDWIYKGSRKTREIDNINEIIDKILLSDSLPSAFIVDKDILAIYLMRELKARSFKIPSDVAIISFGDSQYAELSEPALTSCCVDYEKIGYLAADTILKLINKESIKEKHVYVEPYIIEREST